MIEKLKVEIDDKADNKESVVDALMKRYHVCEEVAEAMVWDSLCTVNGLQNIFNDIDRKIGDDNIYE